jgi:hypothetical protein
MQSGTRVRVGEARAVVSFMNELLASGQRKSKMKTVIILSGDFNTVEGTPEMEVFTAAGLVRLVPSPSSCTWDPSNPNCAVQSKAENEASRGRVENELYNRMAQRQLLLDHVFYRCVDAECKPLVFEGESKAEIVMQQGFEDLPVPSDHYGVLATIELRSANAL